MIKFWFIFVSRAFKKILKYLSIYLSYIIYHSSFTIIHSLFLIYYLLFETIQFRNSFFTENCQIICILKLCDINLGINLFEVKLLFFLEWRYSLKVCFSTKPDQVDTVGSFNFQSFWVWTISNDLFVSFRNWMIVN